MTDLEKKEQVYAELARLSKKHNLGISPAVLKSQVNAAMDAERKQVKIKIGSGHQFNLVKTKDGGLKLSVIDEKGKHIEASTVDFKVQQAGTQSQSAGVPLNSGNNHKREEKINQSEGTSQQKQNLNDLVADSSLKLQGLGVPVDEKLRTKIQDSIADVSRNALDGTDTNRRFKLDNGGSIEIKSENEKVTMTFTDKAGKTTEIFKDIPAKSIDLNNNSKKDASQSKAKGQDSNLSQSEDLLFVYKGKSFGDMKDAFKNMVNSWTKNPDQKANASASLTPGERQAGTEARIELEKAIKLNSSKGQTNGAGPKKENMDAELKKALREFDHKAALQLKRGKSVSADDLSGFLNKKGFATTVNKEHSMGGTRITAKLVDKQNDKMVLFGTSGKGMQKSTKVMPGQSAKMGGMQMAAQKGVMGMVTKILEKGKSSMEGMGL